MFGISKRRKPFSVRSKILLTIGITIAVLSVVVYLISTRVLLTSYKQIEEAGVLQDLGRAHDTIDNFAHQQQIKVNDWSQWDDAYDYAHTHDEGWFERTAFPAGMANADISYVIFSDNTDHIYRLRVIDIEGRVEIASTSENNFFVQNHELLHNPDFEAGHTGLVIIGGKPSMFSSLPIIRGDGTGPIRGSLSFGRAVDVEKVQNFAEFIHLNLTVYVYDDPQLPADVADAKQHLSAEHDHYVQALTDRTIVGYGVYKDIFGNPGLILRVEEPRPIYTQGIGTIYIFLLIAGASLWLFGFAIIWLLERLVIARFVRLTQDVEHINRDQDLTVHVEGGVMDDIGTLAGRINQMLAWLSSARDAEAKSKKEIVGLLDTIKHGKEEAEKMVVQRTHELSDEKARLLASINSLSFGFVIADLNNTIIVRNPSLTAILEMGSVPTTISDIARVFKDVETAKTTFDPVTFAQDVVSQKKTMEKSGISFGKKFLRFLCAPIFADEGNNASVSTDVIGYVFIVEDITDSKNMERSREEFFSIASHELRTPLTAIRWNTDMLLNMKDKINKKDEEEMIRDVHNSSIRLIDIVGDFLEVSRLEQGKIHVENTLFNMGELVERVIHSMQEMADKRGLTLIYKEPKAGESTQVYADVNNTEQVLENLLGNALKFTQKGTITVHMEHNGPFLKVSVTDTGAGISEHNQTRLFQKFQQAGEDMLARDVNQSTGLGLYISKLLMTAMGGTIGLEKSELGKGSTFVFMLRTQAPKA